MSNAQSLNTPRDQLSDSAINADYQTYEGQQAAIKALNDSGDHSVPSASLSKAQCWLDVSFHEFSRNDRSAFPALALEQSVRITQFLQSGGNAQSATNPAADTPLVNDAAKLREDLWSRAQSLRSGPGGQCVAGELACAQVELVHAGNEHNQLGWRHAKPYVQLAEDRIARASVAASECAQVVGKPIEKPIAATPAPVPVQELTLMATVLFNFDRDTISEARRLSVGHLDGLTARLTGGELAIGSIQVVGHADRTQHATQADYNQGLSLRRANAVANRMIQAGVTAELITVSARSSTEPTQECSNSGPSRAEMIECLLPNRRVEVLVTATRAVR